MPRGVKTCPQCQADNGPRAITCKACNHDFFANRPEKPRIEVQATKTNFPQENSSGCNLIFVPGKHFYSKEPFCPVELKDKSREGVVKWANELYNIEWIDCGRRTRFAREAILYFVTDFIPMYIKGVDGENPEYTRAVTAIRETIKPYAEELN